MGIRENAGWHIDRRQIGFHNDPRQCLRPRIFLLCWLAGRTQRGHLSLFWPQTRRPPAAAEGAPDAHRSILAAAVAITSSSSSFVRLSVSSAGAGNLFGLIGEPPEECWLLSSFWIPFASAVAHIRCIDSLSPSVQLNVGAKGPNSTSTIIWKKSSKVNI